MKHTIRGLLEATRPWLEKKGIESARLDAEVLIAHALGMERLQLFLDLDRPLSEEEIARARALVVRRGAREPVAYITGRRWFWKLDLEVSPDVLVPRPDTETLVEEVLKRVPEGADGAFVDVCTGSGCIALALKLERPTLRALATDVSEAACAVARRNAARAGLDIDVRSGDLLGPCAAERALLFVVANPPYIRADERGALTPEVREHEPALALFGEGADGLEHHRRILAAAGPLLAPNGFVALEIGASQGEAVRGLAPAGNVSWGAVELMKDLGGHERVAIWTRVD